jgi:DNA polymerase III sliding clamp (beta) subunit (PCNA family)
MKINREELKDALAIVKPGLASKDLLEQTTSFAFMGNRVVTYNDRISISHPIEGIDITGVVKAEELYGLLSKLKKEEIEIDFDETEAKIELIVKCGRLNAGLRLETEIQLPIEEEIGHLELWEEISDPNFLKYLSFAMNTCSNDLSQPKLTAVAIQENGSILGCDGFRLLECYGEKIFPKDILIPAKSVSEVVKLKPTEWILSKDWVHFRNSADTIISCRLFNMTYIEQPQIDTVLDFEEGGEAIEFPTAIDEMLERVSQFSKRDFVFDEVVTVDISDGKLVLSATSGDTGSWANEKRSVSYKGNVSFSITPVLLRDIIKETRSFGLSPDLDKAKFTPESGEWEYVIMLRKQ